MGYKVGAGSTCIVGLQSEKNENITPNTLLNMTSESISVNVEKGDEGNLLLSKTANQRDLLSIKVEGSVSTILRPEFADWLFEACMGVKNDDNTFTLLEPNMELPLSTFVLSRGGIQKKYKDITIKSVKLSATAQDYVKADLDVVGIKEEECTDTLPHLAFTKPSYRCTSATLYYGNAGTHSDELTEILDVESTDITIDNGCSDSPSVYSSGVYSSPPMMGLRSVKVDFTIPYSEKIDSFKRTYYTAFESPSVALKLKFTTADLNEYIEVYIPNLNITEASGNVDGNDVIESSFSGEALSVCQAEPIVITINHNN